MKKIIQTILLSFIAVHLCAQMNFQDSTVAVITYWDLGESYSYDISLQTLKYAGNDTTSNETISYEVDVTVIDSTATSYTVLWLYKNMKTTSQSPIVQKVISASENVGVKIKISETGAIDGVVNWEEVRDYMKESIDNIRQEIGSMPPELDKVLTQMAIMYSTKEAIEATAIKDVIQFHNFHGAEYKLNEKLTGESLSTNILEPENPFTTNISVELENLDKENNEFKIRSIQEVDSKQLTDATYKFINDMAINLGEEPIKPEDVKPLTNSTETLSIIHNTGWTIESVQWKEVQSDGQTNMEKRYILMK